MTQIHGCVDHGPHAIVEYCRFLGVPVTSQLPRNRSLPKFRVVPLAGAPQAMVRMALAPACRAHNASGKEPDIMARKSKLDAWQEYKTPSDREHGRQLTE